MTKNLKATGGAKGGAAVTKLRSMKSPVVKVRVSDVIISTAYRANSGHCAVSDGVKMAAPWATHIASDLQSFRLTDPRRGLRYTLDSLLLRTPPGSTGWVFVKPIPRNRSTELCAR